MAVPVISNLPPAPTRSDAPADFTPKADAMIGALQPMVVELNASFGWVATQVNAAEGYKNAAATSAGAAANSATAANASKNAAAQSAINATNNGAEQVALAAEQVVLANTARNSAEVLAAAAQAAAGAPSLLGNANKVLRVNAAGTGVAWAYEQQIGDLLSTARNPGAPYLPANGTVYLQSAYPELFAKVGLIGNPAGLVWTFTANTDATLKSAIGTDGKGVWIRGNKRSTDNGATFPTTVATLRVATTAIVNDGGSVWVANYPPDIYRSTDNGLTFAANAGVFPGALEAGQLATDKAGTWIGICYGNHFKVSKDNGLTWNQPATAPVGAQGVVFIGNNTWITSNGYRSTDGGLTWALYGAAAGNPIAFAAMLYTNGVILSFNGSGIRRSIDGGFSWITVNGMAAGTSGFSISTDGTGGILACNGAAGTAAVYSPDYGATWQNITLSAGITAVSFCAYGQGKFIMTGAQGYMSSVETFDYDKLTQFKTPSPVKIQGVTHYIKAKEVA